MKPRNSLLLASFLAAPFFAINSASAASVTTAMIADGAVTSTKLATGSVTAAKIATGAVTASKVATGAVTADKIGTGAVTAAKVATGAVTAAKISAGAVTTDKIAAGAVTADKLAPSALGRAVDLMWLANDAYYDLDPTYRDSDGVLGTGYIKFPFGETDNLDFGLSSSMSFNATEHEITLSKDGLYSFGLSALVYAGLDDHNVGVPIKLEVDIIRGDERMRILEASGGDSSQQENWINASEYFPGKAGDVVYLIVCYSDRFGNDMTAQGRLKNPKLSVTLIHTGDAGS